MRKIFANLKSFDNWYEECIRKRRYQADAGAFHALKDDVGVLRGGHGIPSHWISGLAKLVD
jgi:hypothetical protein